MKNSKKFAIRALMLLTLVCIQNAYANHVEFYYNKDLTSQERKATSRLEQFIHLYYADYFEASYINEDAVKIIKQHYEQILSAGVLVADIIKDSNIIKIRFLAVPREDRNTDYIIFEAKYNGSDENNIFALDVFKKITFTEARYYLDKHYKYSKKTYFIDDFDKYFKEVDAKCLDNRNIKCKIEYDYNELPKKFHIADTNPYDDAESHYALYKYKYSPIIRAYVLSEPKFCPGGAGYKETHHLILVDNIIKDDIKIINDITLSRECGDHGYNLSIDSVITDINNDGKLDIIVSETSTIYDTDTDDFDPKTVETDTDYTAYIYQNGSFSIANSNEEHSKIFKQGTNK